jgi:hypothetical protein
MRRQNLLRLFICAPLLLGACDGGPSDNATNTAATANSANAAATPAATPQKQPVTATVEEATLDAGGKGEASVRLDIAQGFHVHANPASDKFFIATEVRAEPQEGLTPGKPVYPTPVSRKLSFANTPLSLYEGSVVIKLPLTAAKDAAKGRHTLHARVRVQPCDDTACQPPREIDAPIPVTIN